jgi:hypothetical protein
MENPTGKKPVPLTEEQACQFVVHVVTKLTGEAPGTIEGIKLKKLVSAAYRDEGATIVLWR